MIGNENNYNPPLFFKNGHIQTVYPVLFRKVDSVHYTKERITTFDGDFIDLDWSTNNHTKLAIISHGLEGNTSRAYVKGMVKAMNYSGWDALAWNYRSCSGEPNLKLRSYHNGVTDDLAWVIKHAKKKYPYKEIALIGFSLGGNLTLLYLGRETPDAIIKKAIVFSVPCDLAQSAKALTKPMNTFYMKRFLVLLHQKIKAKMKMMPELINDKDYAKIKDFKAFDNRYTAPIHGFKNAHDYWEKCSSKPFIPDIKIPTLIINAANDPFLPKACYPIKEAHANKNVTLLIPKSGGHVGFVSFNEQNLYWSERMAVDFLNNK
ncbi:MAG: alpha/beta fold hydrolase [Desulfobacteraceae bacterium]|nr:alpha/beta fold hydrolase [Desulfobacteraceae bacterium]